MQDILHQIQTYGPIGIVVLAGLDSLGVPLPAAVDALLIGIAATSVQARSVAWVSALLAVVGSTVGNWILFQAAYHGRRLFRRGSAAEETPGKFRSWFLQYGLLTIFIPAVIPILPLPLKVFVISAGAMHTSPGRFLLAIVGARTIRYFGLTWLGLQLGADAQGFLIRNGWTLTGVALAIALGLVVVVRRMSRSSGAPS
jgi:membrane protein DedA with SNARE-associated domain